MKINQYEFLRDGKPFEPTREEIIQFAEHELAEKDKEIAKLTRRLNLTTKYKDDQKERANKYYDEIKQTRHQVCDEIREKLKSHCDYTDEDNIGWYITEGKIDIILDQMEKGE